MQVAMIAEKPREQAISGRFRAGRTYRGRIKDDHKIDHRFSRYIADLKPATAKEAESPEQVL